MASNARLALGSRGRPRVPSGRARKSRRRSVFRWALSGVLCAASWKPTRGRSLPQNNAVVGLTIRSSDRCRESAVICCLVWQRPLTSSVRPMIRIALVVSLTAISAWASAHGNRVPAMIGPDPSLDACSGLDTVSGLRSGRLRVRSGPGLRYATLDSLPNGQSVYACNSRGEWTEIVYKPGARAPEAPECGVASPAPTAQPYDGPCKFGWVRSAWLTVVAG